MNADIYLLHDAETGAAEPCETLNDAMLRARDILVDDVVWVTVDDENDEWYGYCSTADANEDDGRAERCNWMFHIIVRQTMGSHE